MDTWIQDLFYALLIGGIIAWMATIHDPKLKALVYSLPLPIIFTMIATGVNITALNVVGLFLVMIFLWLAFLLHTRWRWHIIVADIAAASIYIVLGLVAIYLAPIPSFLVTSLIYMLLWTLFISHFNPSKDDISTHKRDTIAPSIKLLGATGLAFILLRLKDLLSGIVVTFPFSGVFAVIESRRSLEIQAVVVTRNSPAVLAMFAIIHYGSPFINDLYLILLSIVMYGVCLWFIYRYLHGKV